MVPMTLLNNLTELLLAHVRRSHSPCVSRVERRPRDRVPQPHPRGRRHRHRGEFQRSVFVHVSCRTIQRRLWGLDAMHQRLRCGKVRDVIGQLDCGHGLSRCVSGRSVQCIDGHVRCRIVRQRVPCRSLFGSNGCQRLGRLRWLVRCGTIRHGNGGDRINNLQPSLQQWHVWVEYRHECGGLVQWSLRRGSLWNRYGSVCLGVGVRSSLSSGTLW